MLNRNLSQNNAFMNLILEYSNGKFGLYNPGHIPFSLQESRDNVDHLFPLVMPLHMLVFLHCRTIPSLSAGFSFCKTQDLIKPNFPFLGKR